LNYRDSMVQRKYKVEYPNVVSFGNYPLDLKVPFNRNHLTFHYSAIEWEAPHQLKYTYLLEGLNNNWSQISPATQADYRNIPEGEYRFRVRAIGKNKVWSDEASFSFVVLPPWYRTWWAYCSYILALFALVLSYTNWRTRSLQVQKKVLEDTVSQRTADLKQSNQLLEVQKEEIKMQAFELEKMNELKSKFYSVVGHDLRSPLTKLFAVVFKIKRAVGSKDSEVQTALHEFDGLYRQFVELLDNVLDWGLMDSKDKRLTLKPEHLGELVENVVYLYQTFAQDKRINLYFTDAAQEGRQVNIDKGSIEIVLRNLISNAIKFTNEGGDIEVNLFREDRAVGFSVIDNGVGIASENLKDIFEIKEKKGTLGTKGEKGSGLGLKLAHDFVKMNKGEITIQSEEGTGTTISVSFPTAN
ncbi:MAG: HAMP domain-containing sensor histidine kinase, partial [Bacteroidota bacterium]